MSWSASPGEDCMVWAFPRLCMGSAMFVKYIEKIAQVKKKL